MKLLLLILAFTARATVELPAGSNTATWALIPRSEPIRGAASLELGSPIAADEVRTQLADGRLRIEVDGDGRQGALARCLALLRATENRAREADAPSQSRGSLRLQWIELRRQLAGVERALAQPPPPGGDTEDPRVALSEARELSRRLETSDLGPDLPWRLRLLANEEARVNAERLDIISRGHADAHPMVAEANARLDQVRRRLAAQREVERNSVRSLISELKKLPARPGPAAVSRARALAQAAQLESSPPDDCLLASDAPSSLGPPAEACGDARANYDRLSLRYGDRHPRLIAASAQLEEARRRFTQARALALTELKVSKRPILGTEREQDQRSADALRKLLVVLGDQMMRQDEQPQPLLKVVESCSAK